AVTDVDTPALESRDLDDEVAPGAPSVAPPSNGVAVSTITQAGAQGLHLVLNIVSSLALIRYLGPDGFGGYIFVAITAAYAGLGSDMGLNKLGAREIARVPRDEDRILGSVLATRLSLAVLSLALTLGALALMGATGEVLQAAAVFSCLAFT